MSRLEQRNIVILVALIIGLIIGVGVLANYSGILQARAQNQTQPKVGCASNGTSCALADQETDGASATFASIEITDAAVCCGADKAAGCENEAACSKCGKEDGCDKAKTSGCCDAPNEEGCCASEADSSI